MSLVSSLNNSNRFVSIVSLDIPMPHIASSNKKQTMMGILNLKENSGTLDKSFGNHAAVKSHEMPALFKILCRKLTGLEIRNIRTGRLIFFDFEFL